MVDHENLRVLPTPKQNVSKRTVIFRFQPLIFSGLKIASAKKNKGCDVLGERQVTEAQDIATLHLRRQGRYRGFRDSRFAGATGEDATWQNGHFWRLAGRCVSGQVAYRGKH